MIAMGGLQSMIAMGYSFEHVHDDDDAAAAADDDEW